MKKNEHIARHEFLHRALDELCADFMASHPFDRLSEDVRSANLLSNTTVMDLLSWSSRQTKSPKARRHTFIKRWPKLRRSENVRVS